MNRDIRQSFNEVTVCNSEPETEAFGLRLSGVLEAGDVVALTGDLGAGKTTLTKAIARGLGVRETVTSPTFMILKEYRSGQLPLYHFDVYRLQSAEDLYDIGGDEYFDGDGVCIVEWADIVREAIPEDALWIRVGYGDEEETRIYTICNQ
ncbi:MAG: tRNA (adenosine(37)-N6)-threonylcarbamoyltransferase complex ATPase subunit type 1 TsaE [Mogibacterium sp.]|nr:tRNA (adenosine(37)-N6)-threonylcarbamoyltransferase complex ATPase subunit type 1 TsaE [Mogibacterium sp.]